MESPRVELRHHVEQKRIRVVVQCLVVQKQLRQQAQILRVAFVLPAVDLEEAYRLLSVDFVPRRMPQIALLYMPFETLPTLSVFETKFANVDAGHGTHFLGIRCKVPRFNPMLTQFNQLDVLHARHDVVMVDYHTTGLPRGWRCWNFLRVFILYGGGFSFSADLFLQRSRQDSSSV